MKSLSYLYIFCTMFTMVRLEDEIFTLFEKPMDIINNTSNNETSLETTTPLLESFTSNINTTTEDTPDLINSTYSTNLEETTTVIYGKKKKKKEKKRSKSVTTRKNETCNCDLWFNSCDINCCCDEDCSNDDKNVFTKCIDDDKKITDEWNLKYCSSKKLVYRNNTPWYMEQKSNSLFCVYKDNLPPKLIKNHYKVIALNEEMEDVAKTFLTWSWIKRNKMAQINLSKPYKYSDNVWVIYNNTLKTLSLPIAQIKGHCDSDINMKFMVDYKMSCENSSNMISLVKLQDNLLNSYIVASPENFNESWIQNTTECPKNVCIPINYFSCNISGCQPLNTTNGNNFLANQLQLILYVNGSMGYVNASLFINDEPSNPLFMIKHYWIRKNSTLVPKKLSGNPGYKTGKPIIISMLDNNSSQDTDTLFYFTKNDSSPINHVLFYPLSINGFCYLSNTSYNTINFKENIQTNCQVSTLIDLQNNATVVCNTIYEQILSQFGSNAIRKQDKLFISGIGNPIYDMKSWVDLIYDDESYETKGLLLNNNNTLQCTNMATKFNFEFAFASIINPTFKKQNNILGARLKLHRDCVEFSVKNNTIESVLSLSVRFMDLTTNQIIEYAKGPNFHINLPTDFFYPFSLNEANAVNFSHIFFSTAILCIFYSFIVSNI